MVDNHHMEAMALAFLLEGPHAAKEARLTPGMFQDHTLKAVAEDIFRGYPCWKPGLQSDKTHWMPVLTAKTSSIHTRHEFAKKVRRRYEKAQKARSLADQIRRLSDDSDDCSDILGGGDCSQVIGAHEIADITSEHYTRPRSFDTPWPVVRDMMAYMGPGDVYLLVGDSSVGKTNFTFQATEGMRVLYFGADMTTAAVGKRFWEIQFYRRNKESRQPIGWLKRECHAQFLEAAKNALMVERAIPAEFRTVDTSSISIESIEYVVRDQQRSGWTPQVVVIDYLGRIDTEKRFSDEWRKDKHIANTLKHLAKATKTPVLALCQLRKEAKPFTKPEIAMIQGSSDLRPTVDGIICLWRDSRKNKDGQIVQNSEYLWVSDDLKSRDFGGAGSVKLRSQGLYLSEWTEQDSKAWPDEDMEL